MLHLELFRGQVVQAHVRPFGVGVLAPGFDHRPAAHVGSAIVRRSGIHAET